MSEPVRIQGQSMVNFVEPHQSCEAEPLPVYMEVQQQHPHTSSDAPGTSSLSFPISLPIFECDICSSNSTAAADSRQDGRTPQFFFAAPDDLQTHFAEAHGRLIFYECSHCSRLFGEKHNLNIHFKTHASDGEAHKEQQHKERSVPQPTECDVCGRSFEYPSHLRRHMAVHTDSKYYKCKMCDERFRYASEMRLHMLRLHTPPDAAFRTPDNRSVAQSHTCEVCGKMFAYTSYLRRHMKTHADGSGPLTCLHCNEKFAIQSRLERHIQKEHTIDHMEEEEADPQKSLVCPICKKFFVYPSEFMRHVKTHSASDDRLTCSYCRGKFKTEHTLANHMIHKHNVYKKRETRVGNGKTGRNRKRKTTKAAAPSDDTAESEEETEAESDRLRCVYCHKICASESRLISHLQLVHKDTSALGEEAEEDDVDFEWVRELREELCDDGGTKTTEEASHAEEASSVETTPHVLKTPPQKRVLVVRRRGGGTAAADNRGPPVMATSSTQTGEEVTGAAAAGSVVPPVYLALPTPSNVPQPPNVVLTVPLIISALPEVITGNTTLPSVTKRPDPQSQRRLLPQPSKRPNKKLGTLGRPIVPRLVTMQTPVSSAVDPTPVVQPAAEQQLATLEQPSTDLIPVSSTPGRQLTTTSQQQQLLQAPSPAQSRTPRRRLSSWSMGANMATQATEDMLDDIMLQVPQMVKRLRNSDLIHRIHRSGAGQLLVQKLTELGKQNEESSQRS